MASNEEIESSIFKKIVEGMRNLKFGVERRSRKLYLEEEEEEEEKWMGDDNFEVWHRTEKWKVES